MTSKSFMIDDNNLQFSAVADFAFNRQTYSQVKISGTVAERVQIGFKNLDSLIKKNIPIYGVTTGFGDSCHNSISPENATELQKNLVSYLLCGTGAPLPVEASRAMFLVRFKSLSRGYSGVSLELIERMRLFLEKDWIPVCPREGSLGASGDLIPLAYLAQNLQGDGQVYVNGQVRLMAEVLQENKVPRYEMKPKESLAIVNGTSTMCGMYLYNLSSAKYLAELISMATSWLCLALKGRTEAFGELVNELAKSHPGQSYSAKSIRTFLAEENYQSTPIDQIGIKNGRTEEFVQDRYSLRCTPQVMGPIFETIEMLEKWFEREASGTSDNPLVGEAGNLAMGGNFYGGHLSHGMDYLKICLAHMADLTDRQLMTLIDEKTNRGLPANLADWNSIPKEKKFLHHGLKGLHQAVNAITSEIISRTMPTGVFSRSSESHNQDKVSLGMSAAVRCSEMIEPMFTISAMNLICLAQALDLRGIKLQGAASQEMYDLIRAVVPKVSFDQPMDQKILQLATKLKDQANSQKRLVH